jgi:pSer/pThr/pTyr-binding forkhead associated (FHA) protein
MRTMPQVVFSLDELRRFPEQLRLTAYNPKVKQTVQLMGAVRVPPTRMLVERTHNTHTTPLTFRIEKERVLIGRDADCDLIVNHDKVSRHHAELWRENGRWIVRDLNSTNRTFVSYVGDPRLLREVKGNNAIKNGSIICFGPVSYTFLIDEGS